MGLRATDIEDARKLRALRHPHEGELKPRRECRHPISEAAFAVAQFVVAYSLVAQFGSFLAEGHAQLVFNLSRLLGLLH
jgi:hypothetical protein